MLIGAAGKAGSGKGVFASIAKEEFGAEIITFAAGVKEEVSEFLKECAVNFNASHLYGTQDDKEHILRICHLAYPKYMNDFFTKHGLYSRGKYYFTPRSLMQWWGTEYRRAQDPQYWVKKAMAKVADPKQLYVFDDMRFPNEAEALIFADGYLLQILRPSAVTIANMDHASETALDLWTRWHYVIHNNTSLEEYEDACRSLLTILQEQ